MKTKLTVLGVLAAAALSLDASAQEWTLVAMDGARLTFADGTSVRRNEIAASAWVLESFTAVNHTDPNWRPYRSRSARYIFNCSERIYTIAESILHAGALGHGASGPSLRTEAPRFAPAEKGSPQAALLAAVCDDALTLQGKLSAAAAKIGVQRLAPAPQRRGRALLIQSSVFGPARGLIASAL